MTKYVLNPGGIKRQPELKKKFHRELVKDLGDHPKFLLCNFAQGCEHWEPKFKDYSDAIAEDVPATFAEQCRRADVIYFHGGDDHLLQYRIKQFNLADIFKGKVVATNSASSDMLATHHWTPDWRQCANGLGILPIKFIPHYQSSLSDADPRGPIDWQKAYDDLAKYDDTNLPIHSLKEGEFIVVEQT